eukprot:TRINITY_DN18376_c0_g1_i1.p1 TRINITY_DN18376_c0_g1~~TRINITY_DN18376_c0_g1_i1.p1  ORF type:complete len:291 (+),score=85.04 TRINITY_DN18376_c0_g1_i1:59-874(+)
MYASEDTAQAILRAVTDLRDRVERLERATSPVPAVSPSRRLERAASPMLAASPSWRLGRTASPVPAASPTWRQSVRHPTYSPSPPQMRATSMSPSRRTAMDLCSEGNALFAEGEFAASVSRYGAALRVRPDDAHLLVNRSAALLAAGDATAALRDAVRAVELRPRWVKAYARCGLAQRRMGMHSDAAQSFDCAMRLSEHGDGAAGLRILRDAAASDSAAAAAVAPDPGVRALWRPLGCGGGAADAVRERRLDLDRGTYGTGLGSACAPLFR